jgi:CheY-like chemotaxis protein
MEPSAQCRGQTPALRILIVDNHDISRAAFRALLRTEGMNVVSDLGAGDDVLAAASALRPDVAIVDVAPQADAAFGMARKLRALPSAPTVILTSSADRALFGPELNGHPFLAKADIHASALRHLAESGTDGAESPSA